MSEPLVDRVCAVCGKNFIPAPYHRFKRYSSYNNKPIYYCGWNCYSKDDRDSGCKKNGKEIPVEAYSTRGEFIRSYSSLKEAHEETGESITAIHNCLDGVTKATRGGYVFRRKEKAK